MRSQIALWMLTKMAMLFFIIALALFATTLGNIQRTSMCSNQAYSVAQAVGGVINNVINSPMEDERKIFALESSLSIGKTDFQRYAINILKVTESGGIGNPETGFFSILVRPFSEETAAKFDCTTNECCGRSNVPFENFIVDMHSNAGSARNPGTQTGEVLVAEPSNPQGRSRFLVVIKCKTKQIPTQNYLVIEDCTREIGTDCLNFETVRVTNNLNPCAFPQ
ncbi:MAG: hypothetical protein NTY90_02330 [Candidatus Micrarchaeota archaeon]|nr:hypothetical protein [Candidatus Micrarchaeota archaeon]